MSNQNYRTIKGSLQRGHVLNKEVPKLALPGMAPWHQQGCSCCCYSNPGWSPLSLWAIPLQERLPGTHKSGGCEIREKKPSLSMLQAGSKLPDVPVDGNQLPLAWPTHIPHSLCGVWSPPKGQQAGQNIYYANKLNFSLQIRSQSLFCIVF